MDMTECWLDSVGAGQRQACLRASEGAVVQRLDAVFE